MTVENPWKTLSTRVVYENDWITLREDQVIRPDGKPGIYSVVSTRIATGVVALSADEQVYLVGQYRYPTKEYSWEIVEGGTDGAEQALDAARRELREEAGVIASEIIQLGDEFHLSNCFSSEIGFVFLARGLSEVQSEPDGTEILQLRKVPFDECIKMIQSGEIKDAVTIIGLYRAARYLGRKI